MDPEWSSATHKLTSPEQTDGCKLTDGLLEGWEQEEIKDARKIEARCLCKKIIGDSHTKLLK